VAASAIGVLAGIAANVLPLALDGESATEAGPNNTALAVISLVSIIVGYLVLFALWRWVFSPKARARRRKAPASDRSRGGADRLR
jgi:flagellar biosynthesis/type III secretory pathway M-ring protein FliF/YscJ